MEDVAAAAAAFISGLQVTNPFYKYLVKNDVTKIRNILARAQKYIQIEEATRAASSRILRQGPKVEKSKPQLPSKRNGATIPPLSTSLLCMLPNPASKVK